MKLPDRTVAITGATGPVGRAAARRLAGTGVNVALIGRNEPGLAEVAAEAHLGPDEWVAGVGDLRSPDGVREALDPVLRRFGRVDVLLHLVGGWVGGTPVAELDPDEVRSMLDQHLWSTLHTVQAVVPGMVERGWGRIAAVTSPLAAEPGPRGASYAIGKAAEEALLRSVAREVAGTGVTANLVVIRTVDTAHERESAPSARNRGWTTPEEAAETLAFLASDASAAINGARIPLYGRG